MAFAFVAYHMQLPSKLHVFTNEYIHFHVFNYIGFNALETDRSQLALKVEVELHIFQASGRAS